MQKITIMGNLGADPEKRYTAEGNMIYSIRVCANRKNPRNPDGDKIATWYRVTAFGNDGEETWLTERISRLGKGDPVYVQGNLEVGEFERQDGSKGTSLDIRWVDTLFKIDWMRDRDEDEEQQERPQRRQPAASGARRAPAQQESDDSDLEDLPF